MSNKTVELEHKSCLRRYIEHCESISMNKQSVSSRKSSIKKFLAYLLSKEIRVQDAEYTDVEEYLEYEQDNDTSLATINS